MRVDSPISAALVCWGNAWLTGHVGLDEAVDRVENAAGPCLVTGDPPVPLRRYLADLRVAGLRALRLALPVPGDPLGLTGPPAFNSAAIEAGEAVVAMTPSGCVGLIPAPDRRGSSYSGVLWSAQPAADTPPDLPSLSEAEHALARAMRTATEVLTSVGGPPRARTGGMPHGDTLAPGYPARAHRLAALSGRLAGALRLAEDRGLTAAHIGARAAALRELDRAVRRARVAAHHAILEPR